VGLLCDVASMNGLGEMKSLFLKTTDLLLIEFLQINTAPI